MGLAVYDRATNQVRTVIREDHGGYVPPDGWELVAIEKLPAGWTPEPLSETARADRVAEIKRRCEEDILAQIPAWKQRNLTARGLELARKEYHGEKFTPEEQAEYAAIETAWAWVKERRTASDAEEAQLRDG